MKTRVYWSIVLVCCCVIGAYRALAAATPIGGTFALQGEMAQTSASLTASPLRNDPLKRRLDIVLMNMGSRMPIRSYDTDMTKLMHLIVVNDDFTLFLHLHPVLQKNGHFILDQRFPFPGLYHIYGDAQPHGMGQQVFRFDVPIGSFRTAQKRDMSETNATAYIQGYTVILSTNTFSAGNDAMLGVQILKSGQPATDLHPYLGAAAHAVFLNADDLSYVHVHPMSASTAMGSGTESANATASTPMTLHVALSEPGIYKLWLQFRGGNQLIVAPFVITAR